jgi:hypothetical protein
MTMPGLPPDLAERIMVFLSTDRTGTIELQVKAGRILGAKISETLDFKEIRLASLPPRRLDETVPVAQDSGT